MIYLELKNFLIPGTRENWVGMVFLVASAMVIVGWNNSNFVETLNQCVDKYNALADKYNEECAFNYSGSVNYNKSIGGVLNEVNESNGNSVWN